MNIMPTYAQPTLPPQYPLMPPQPYLFPPLEVQVQDQEINQNFALPLVQNPRGLAHFETLPRENRFAQVNPMAQQTQQLLYDFYRKNVNSNIFNQRSRSHQHLDLQPGDLRQQYAKILEFQAKEQAALKARKKSEEKSLSPEQYSFFDKFGLSDKKSIEYQTMLKQKHLRETLKQQIEEKEKLKDVELREKERYELQLMRSLEGTTKYNSVDQSQIVESLTIPQTSKPFMTDEYKAELMQQIEDKKKEKMHEKQKKMEEDLKDEQRVKRELEELRHRYEDEIGLKKKRTQMTISEEPSQSESQKQSQEPESDDYLQPKVRTAKKDPMKKAFKPHKKYDGDYPTTDEVQYMSDLASSQIEPLRKQMQSQLQHFQKDLQRLQQQQKEMVKNYKKEMDTIQSKKKSVISEMKNDQEKEMKKQIERLQKALDQINKRQSELKDMKVNTGNKPDIQQKSSFPREQTQKKRIHISKSASRQVDVVDLDDEEEQTGSQLPNRYQKDGQIILHSTQNKQKKSSTPVTSQKLRQNKKYNHSKSLAEMMQGTSEDKEEEELQSFRSKKSQRSKMLSVVSASSPEKQKHTQIKKQNSMLPPKQTAKSKLNSSVSIIPKNAENENLSITNLMKRMGAVDNQELPLNFEELNHQNSNQLMAGKQTPSILRKNSAPRSALLRNSSSKNVRINESHTESELKPFQHEELEDKAGDFIENQEFQIGKEVPLIAEDKGSEYLQRSRDFEKHYYEDILKPHKVKQNIESHQNSHEQQVLIPNEIGGIKVSGLADETGANPLKEEEQQEIDSARYSHFLFNKNLLHSDQQDPQENIADDYIQEEPFVPEERPQYLLSQRNGEEGSFKDYEGTKNETQTMKDQLKDIQRIIHQNSVMSEDHQTQLKKQASKGVIEFNKSFQKSLKQAEMMFEDEKKKQSNNLRTLVNISDIKYDEKAQSLMNSSTRQLNDISSNRRKSFDSIEGFATGLPQFLSKPHREDLRNTMLVEDSTKSFQNRKVSDLKEEKEENQHIIQKNPNILDFLQRNKPLKDEGSHRTPVRLTESKSQYSQMNNLQEQTPKHFANVLKSQLIPQPSNIPDQRELSLFQQSFLKSNIIRTSPQHRNVQSENTQIEGLLSKPPLPQSRQHPQKSIEIQKVMTTPQSKNQNQSLINVFTENSRINEEKIPFHFYSNLLQEEVPANKIYDKKDPFLINLNLRKKLSETNQMIHIDNQNLLEKIKLLGKSIKPVQYGFPYIDLTKSDAFFDEDHQEAIFRQQMYTRHLKKQMNEYFGNNDPVPQIDIANSRPQTATKETLLNLEPSRYMNYNFNGERGMDLKHKILNKSRVNEESQCQKLLKFANNLNNDLIKDIVQSKIKQEEQLFILENSQNTLGYEQRHSYNKRYIDGERAESSLDQNQITPYLAQKPQKILSQISDEEFQELEEEKGNSRTHNNTHHRNKTEQNNKSPISIDMLSRSNGKRQLTIKDIRSLDSFFSENQINKRPFMKVPVKEKPLQKLPSDVVKHKQNQMQDDQLLMAKTQAQKGIFDPQSAGVRTPSQRLNLVMMTTESKEDSDYFDQDKTDFVMI